MFRTDLQAWASGSSSYRLNTSLLFRRSFAWEAPGCREKASRLMDGVDPGSCAGPVASPAPAVAPVAVVDSASPRVA